MHWEAKHKNKYRESYGPHERLMKFIEQHREEFGNKILDIDCGNGRNLVPLTEQGFDVTGLDISDEVLKKLTERLEDNDLNAKLVQGETAHLPFEENNFDSIISLGTIHYNKWKDVQQSFEEAKRVLRDDGFFFLKVRSINDTAQPRKQIKDDEDSPEVGLDRKSTRLNSSHTDISRMPSSA